ncbi:MAG: hypothetical protein AAFZ18_09615, partial [Myxococcota bacterium]
MYRERRSALLALCLGVTLAACTEAADSNPPPSESPDAGVAPVMDMGAAPSDPNDTVVTRSASPALKRKTGTQLTSDLAQALELPREAVCAELGLYRCEEAHRIVLGGVEPYSLRIDRPLGGVPVSAPIATDRLALSACGARVEADFTSDPVLFGPLVSGSPDGRALVVDALYDRFLGRAPTATERAELSAFAPDASDREFAQLACFV